MERPVPIPCAGPAGGGVQRAAGRRLSGDRTGRAPAGRYGAPVAGARRADGDRDRRQGRSGGRARHELGRAAAQRVALAGVPGRPSGPIAARRDGPGRRALRGHGQAAGAHRLGGAGGLSRGSGQCLGAHGAGHHAGDRGGLGRLWLAAAAVDLPGDWPPARPQPGLRRRGGPGPVRRAAAQHRGAGARRFRARLAPDGRADPAPRSAAACDSGHHPHPGGAALRPRWPRARLEPGRRGGAGLDAGAGPGQDAGSAHLHPGGSGRLRAVAARHRAHGPALRPLRGHGAAAVGASLPHPVHHLPHSGFAGRIGLCVHGRGHHRPQAQGTGRARKRGKVQPLLPGQPGGGGGAGGR